MSGACLAAVLAYREYCAFWKNSMGVDCRGFYPGQLIGAIRYVDDVLAASPCLCGDCIFTYLKKVYDLPLSACSGTATTQGAPHIWTEGEVLVSRDSFRLIPKNMNRSWLSGEGPRVRQSFVPWPGAPPCSIKFLVSHFLGMIARHSGLGIAPHDIIVRALEALLELRLLGYPHTILRKVLYAM